MNKQQLKNTEALLEGPQGQRPFSHSLGCVQDYYSLKGQKAIGSVQSTSRDNCSSKAATRSCLILDQSTNSAEVTRTS